MKLHNLTIECKTQLQTLRCFNLVYLNMGFLGELNISKYQRKITIEGLPFKFQATKLIKLIKSKKLRFELIRLTTRDITKTIEEYE